MKVIVTHSYVPKINKKGLVLAGTIMTVSNRLARVLENRGLAVRILQQAYTNEV